MKYVKVVIDQVSDHVDTLFTYACPDDNVRTGSVVKVLFGRGNRLKTAYVFSVEDDNSEGIKGLKEVVSVEDTYVLPEDLVEICRWMKERYVCRYIDAVKCVIPPGAPPKRGLRKDPYGEMDVTEDLPPELTEEQRAVVDEIDTALDTGQKKVFLLNGVTSSGKTEVYMRAAARALEQGRGALVLVPEISLTPQTVARFVARFGSESVAVLHSRLTKGQRYDQWMRIRNGGAKILIGARSGVFAPFERLGVIVLDEEHDSSYKSDMTPKYDAIETAVKRAELSGAVVILGSATPSVISRYNAEQGLYKELRMKKRYNKTPLPHVHVVDMREELKKGNKTIFSARLLDSTRKTLASGKQAIFFLNRRGYSSFISCRSCGFVMKCDVCGVSLTYHRSSGMAECHYCGKKVPVPKVCPECGGRYIKYFGAGTEQVEEFAKQMFEGYNVARLDLDTTARKGEAERILGAFKKGKIHILVGTQLVAKGLDFANVGLVGVIAADVTLNIPDYRSAERTFQLIVQSSGRAGRGDEAGNVVIQTYSPEERAVRDAAAGDYDSFYRHEIRMRKLTGYPPFTDIIRLVFCCENSRAALAEAEAVYEEIAGSGIADRFEVFSPQPAYMAKLNGDYRFHMLIKSPHERTAVYMDMIAGIKERRTESKKTASVMVVELNPYSFT